jgi:DNA gyrase subunit A
VKLEPNDTVAAVVTARGFDEETDLFFVSRKGLVKRTNFSLFKNLRSNGLRSYDCAEGDELFIVRKTTPEQEILIATAQGLAIRFRGTDVRSMGRIARGVRGIALQNDDWIVSVEILEKADDKLLLTVTEKGFGKRTALSEYRLQGRGGKGIINIRTGDRNGHVVGSVQVADEDKVMLITNTGRIIKTRVHEVRETGRAALGVTMMRVSGKERIVGVTRVVEDDEEEEVLDEVALTDGGDSESGEAVETTPESEE